MRPKITIDYTPAVRQSAGIGRIIREQVRAVIALNAAEGFTYELRLFVAGRVGQADRDVAPLRLHNTPLISERSLVRAWHRLNLPLPRVEWFAGDDLALFHATDFVLAPSRAHKKIVTVHDLAFLFYPEAALPSLHHYLHTVVPRSIRRADHLLADSQHTARDLREQYDIPMEQITVVQGAVDHGRFCPQLAQGDAIAGEAARLRARYGIGEGPFILGLSTLQPRKNFGRLIEAFALAREEKNLPHKLVIGGSKGWLFDEIFARVVELGLLEQVLFPGFVADEDLPALYRAADFFAFPSLYEGFGLPILESLACGTPVLSADNSCLPEAAGPGAIYVEAESVESIAAGIIKLAESEPLRSDLALKGREHALQFTWKRSARQLLDAYDKVIG